MAEISWFPVSDKRDLPDDLQSLFAKARERIGFVPNVFRAYAFRPERLRASFTHFRMLHEPTPALGDCDPSDIATLTAHGLTADDVWDVAEIAAMYNFTNRLAMATGMLPNEEYHALAR